jgi:phenylpyruvate tautomerase PptA (4-oxalocrotonate tautomerase family)
VPLIEIAASPTALGAHERSDVLRAVNTAVPAALSAAPDAAWSIWRDVDESTYVIGGDDAPAYEGPLPPVVHVYARRTPEEWALIVDAVERVLRELLDLDDTAVLITTQPFRA